jgi:hypothetical protein
MEPIWKARNTAAPLAKPHHRDLGNKSNAWIKGAPDMGSDVGWNDWLGVNILCVGQFVQAKHLRAMIQDVIIPDPVERSERIQSDCHR